MKNLILIALAWTACTPADKNPIAQPAGTRTQPASCCCSYADPEATYETLPRDQCLAITAARPGSCWEDQAPPMQPGDIGPCD